jgi:hypothetical protein
MDELAVYDRRGSMTWAQYKERFPLFIDTKRVKDDLFIPLKKSRWWRPHRRFLCVEAGETAVSDYGRAGCAQRDLGRGGNTAVNAGVANRGREAFQGAPGGLRVHDVLEPLDRKQVFDWSAMRYWKNYPRYNDTTEEALVENPILDGSFMASMIPADDIWKALYEYLMSLNDKPIIDNRPDDLKIEAAGFDTKTSFRKTKD